MNGHVGRGNSLSRGGKQRSAGKERIEFSFGHMDFQTVWMDMSLGESRVAAGAAGKGLAVSPRW